MQPPCTLSRRPPPKRAAAAASMRTVVALEPDLEPRVRREAERRDARALRAHRRERVLQEHPRLHERRADDGVGFKKARGKRHRHERRLGAVDRAQHELFFVCRGRGGDGAGCGKSCMRAVWRLHSTSLCAKGIERNAPSKSCSVRALRTRSGTPSISSSDPGVVCVCGGGSERGVKESQ